MRKDCPDVVVVKKHYPRIRKKNRKRYWKLDRIPMKTDDNIDYDENKSDGEDEKIVTKKAKKAKNNKKLRKKKLEQDFREDFEQFLQDLEEDPEMRSTINMYKDQKAIDDLEGKLNSLSLNDKTKEIHEINKLIKKKKILKVKRKTKKGEELKKQNEENDAKTKMLMKAIKEDDESDLEEDFPAIQLNELMDNLKIDSDDDQ